MANVEGMTWEFGTALRGASERLAPILMTAWVTGLGLLPLADREWRPRSRNRGTDGSGHSRRLDDLYRAELTNPADACAALRALRDVS